MENDEKIALPLNIKIKTERISPQKELTPPLNEEQIEAKHDVLLDLPPIEEPEQKKVSPVKSSNEILAELFQVFNAAPPKSLLSNNIEELLRDSRASKKHHRKKHKRKHEEDGSGSDSDHHTKSKKKKKANRKIKEEHVESKHLEDGELATVTSKDKKHSKKSKKRKKSKSRSPEKESKDSKVKTEKVNKVQRSISSSNNKIQINLKNTKFVDKPNEATKRKYDHDDFSSELSLSDEFDDSNSIHYDDNKRYNDFYRSSDQHGYRSRSRDRHHRTSPRRSSKDREYYRHDSRYGTSRRNSNYHNSSRYHRSYSRSRSRSRSGERIDKKRLLEIARKNAITMLKSGTLPGSQYLAPDIKEKALEKMRYGGKTIEELTEYCRKLSNGECLGDLSSVSGDDSDHDKEGNEKAFHHPFVLKERGPIVMNIKNAVPIAPKSAEQTKALLMQYPVSSGQQHRLNESEWVPVKPTKASESVATQSKKSSRQPSVQGATKVGFNEWSSKTGPQPAVPEANIAPPVVVPENVPIQYPTVRPVYETNKPVEPTPPVFPELAQLSGDFDISSIITQRLNAMRKLQDNPQDGEAQLLMNNAQDSMSAWLSSKHTPGQFIGSTGATILTAKQLSPGLQAWAKKDQLVMTQPVAGGMGMHLLQKMGWKPGEGLGKDKTGSLIPLLLEVKLDKKGLLATEENPINQQKRKINKKILAANVEHKHPVSLLGELAAKRKWATPVYDMVDESGPGHNKNFLFKVIVNGKEFVPTTPAANKKEAKAITAKFALQQMRVLSS